MGAGSRMLQGRRGRNQFGITDDDIAELGKQVQGSHLANPVSTGTDQIATQFAGLGGGGVCFEAPVDTAVNWMPKGYELVTDPEHILTGSDCILHYLSADWRLVSDVNAGARIGRRACDAGNDVRYVTKPIK